MGLVVVDVEDFLADAVQGVGEDVAQGRHDVGTQDRARVPGHGPEVGDEVASQALEVAQRAQVVLARPARATRAARPFAPAAPFAPVAPAAPLVLGVVAQAGSLFLQPVGVRECLVARLAGLLTGLARPVARGVGRLPGALPGRTGLLARLVPGVPLGTAHLPCGPGGLFAEAAHGVPDVFAHLADDVADGRGQVLFQLVELVAAAAQLLAAPLGDPVDLAPVLLVVRDQALFLKAGRPRVDRAWRGSVDAHEAIAQQPDYLIAVPWLLVEQAQQVEPKASMAENRGHWVLLSIPTGAPRSSVTAPDMVVTDTCPVAAPTLPLTVCEAGALTVRSVSNSVLTAPDVDRSDTFASLSAGSRSVTSPDIVLTCTLPPSSSETSAVTCPLTVSTAREP